MVYFRGGDKLLSMTPLLLINFDIGIRYEYISYCHYSVD